jgi:hypothetical protein
MADLAGGDRWPAMLDVTGTINFNGDGTDPGDFTGEHHVPWHSRTRWSHRQLELRGSRLF